MYYICLALGRSIRTRATRIVTLSPMGVSNPCNVYDLWYIIDGYVVYIRNVEHATCLQLYCKFVC